MRWLPYLILAYIALGLQIGLAPYLAYRGAAPNLVLLAVVFIAVHAPRDAALLGCFALGFCQDLLTVQQVGLLALSYGLVGVFIVNTQQVVYKEHPLTHFSLALAAGLITAAIVIVHGLIHPPHVRISTELVRLLYTAILAPIALGVLQRMRGIFGFQPGRRRLRAW